MSSQTTSDTKRSWYSQTFSDDEEENSHHANNEVAPSDSCNSAARLDDIGSDVSTEVGEEEVYISDLLDFETDVDSALTRHAQFIYERPSFLKASRQQRIDQSKRVVDECAMLDFDSADASSQESLVMRKLVLFKSLKDFTIYCSGSSRRQETRLSLLGLLKDVAAFDEIASRAQHLCESRQFRLAFNVLQEAIVCIFGQARHQMPAGEIEAMNLRRLQKRQRHREERREERRQDRKERSAQRSKDDQCKQLNRQCIDAD